ncbi:transposase [Actinoallomurus sp. NPDC052274]|uniref:transposase n=1 Tax=Actinoallomurus sp. NPDC052274 TaxID=3155420 RepID=UPI003428BBD3
MTGGLVATLAVTRRFDLTDAQWARLEPLLPVPTRPGRPSKWTKRQLIDGIRWRVRVGAPWRDVPECYGSWQAVYGLFRRWQRAGVWQEILTGLQARADAARLITWDVSVDSTSRAGRSVTARDPCGAGRSARRVGRRFWWVSTQRRPFSAEWTPVEEDGRPGRAIRGDRPLFSSGRSRGAVPDARQSPRPWCRNAGFCRRPGLRSPSIRYAVGDEPEPSPGTGSADRGGDEPAAIGQ